MHMPLVCLCMHMPLGNQTRTYRIIVLLSHVVLVNVPHANAQSAPAVYQVVSGLRKYMPLDALVGRRVVLVANMKPAAMRGVKSQAMVLCASSLDGAQARARSSHAPESCVIPSIQH